MYMKIKQHILKKAVDILKKYNDEIKLVFKEDGIHSIICDPANYELIKIRIPHMAMEEYKLEETLEIGIDVKDKLGPFLRLFKKDDMVNISYDSDTHRLIFQVGNLVRKMGLIDTTEMTDPKIPKCELNNKFTINSKLFYNCFNKVVSKKQYTFELELKLSKDKITFEEFIEYPDENQDIASMSIDKNIDDFQIEYIGNDTNNVLEGKEVLKNLNEFQKSIEYLTVETNGYKSPMKITGKSNFLEVEYWRAPRIPSDEYLKQKQLQPIEKTEVEKEEIEEPVTEKIEEPLISELRYGATEIFLYKDTWFYNGDIEHNGIENIEQIMQKL